MKKTIIAAVFLVAGFICLPPVRAHITESYMHTVTKETYLYSVKGTDSLWLDKYDTPEIEGPKPCVIYIFGGAFVQGERDDQRFVPFFDWLVTEGYCVVSIDYRLGLKPLAEQQEQHGNVTRDGFAGIFLNTLDMAVEDMFDATRFVCENAGQWGINPELIVVCGSSSGAITALTGVYNLCNEGQSGTNALDGFSYAGVISMAGAIFTTSEVMWDYQPCPMLLLHGDADRNVPYGKATVRGMGFYGPSYIASQFADSNTPYWFLSFRNAEHEIAGTPMNDNRKEILTFLDCFVRDGQPLMMDTEVIRIGSSVQKKKYSIMDYVKHNFGI